MEQNKLARGESHLTITKAKSLPHGQFEAILSTDDLDRHGEHVSIKGLEIPKNQVIKMYYNHETNGMNLPIGKWLNVWKKDGKLYGHGEVDMEDDFAVKVYKKVLKGIIDSISVGFYPTEYDGETSTWTKSTLVEASVVAEPANVNAVITSKELGFTQEDFKKSLKVKLKDAVTDEEVVSEVIQDTEQVTVKTLNKGIVEDVLTEPKKWEMMSPFYDVMYAFERAYYKEETPAADFEKLLNETIEILTTVANGTYDLTGKNVDVDESGDSPLAELKTAIGDLNSRQGALEDAMKAATENPAKKNVEKVRFVLKQVDQSVEKANRVIKVQLKETK